MGKSTSEKLEDRFGDGMVPDRPLHIELNAAFESELREAFVILDGADKTRAALEKAHIGDPLAEPPIEGGGLNATVGIKNWGLKGRRAKNYIPIVGEVATYIDEEVAKAEETSHAKAAVIIAWVNAAVERAVAQHRALEVHAKPQPAEAPEEAD